MCTSSASTRRSKTVCQLGDADGNVLRESRGPGANLQSAGELEVEKVLHDVLVGSADRRRARARRDLPRHGRRGPAGRRTNC
jgi:hypothetical protein